MRVVRRGSQPKTTYGDLKPGDFFEFPTDDSRGAVRLRTTSGYAHLNGTGLVGSLYPECAVRFLTIDDVELVG